MFITSRSKMTPQQVRRLAARRLVPALVLVAGALAATSMPLLACDMDVLASATSGVVGDEVSITVAVRQTHRNCTVPIEDTQIRLSGVSLVCDTPWAQVSSLDYTMALAVRLDAAGEGRVEVVRTCSKGGDISCVTIAVAAAATPLAGGTDTVSSGAPSDGGRLSGRSPSDSGDAPVPDAVDGGAIDIPAASSVEGSLSWQKAFWTTVKQPQTVVLFVLMAVGTVLVFLRSTRRVRPFAMLASAGFLGFYIGGCPCPIGSLQNTIIHADDVAGHMTAYVQLGAVVVAAVLFGRVFCGWACPLGAVQYFLFRRDGGRKNQRLEIPRERHDILRWAKYGALLVMIVLVVLTGQPVFEDIDPFRLLFNLDFRWGVPLLFLIVLLAVSVIIGFPFCKYLCPLGAFLGLLQPLSLFRMRLSGACSNCKLCVTALCDHRAIEEGGSGPVVNQSECVRCGECMSSCPRSAITLVAGRG